jgi:hypothetical protein
VPEEAEYGKRNEILFPVFIERVDPPYGFSRIQTADLNDWTNSPDFPGFNAPCQLKPNGSMLHAQEIRQPIHGAMTLVITMPIAMDAGLNGIKNRLRRLKPLMRIHLDCTICLVTFRNGPVRAGAISLTRVNSNTMMTSLTPNTV